MWAQSSSLHHPFVTYFADVETQEPVRWVFFDGGLFDVQQWVPGGTLPDEQWQLPAYCFEEEEDGKDDGNDDDEPESGEGEDEEEVATATV